jgi:hypothetical protein
MNIIAKAREKIKEIVRHEFINSFLSSLSGCQALTPSLFLKRFLL